MPVFCMPIEFRGEMHFLKFQGCDNNLLFDEDSFLQRNLSLHHSQFQTDRKSVQKF